MPAPGDAQPEGAERRRGRRWKTWVVRGASFLALALALYALLGYVVLPWQIERQIEARGPGGLGGRAVAVGRVEVDPFALRMVLRDVTVADNAPGTTLLAFDALEAHVSGSSLRHRALVLRSVRLVAPRLELVHLGAGRWNVSDLFEKRSDAPDTGPPAFSLSNIEVVDGRIGVQNRANGARHRIEALALGLPFLSTLPVHADLTVQPRLSAVIDGAPLSATVDAHPFAQPYRGVMRLSLQPLDLAGWLPYLPRSLPVAPKAGVLSADLAVEFAERPDAAPRVSASGQARLRDLRIDDGDGGPLVSAKALTVGIKAIEPLAPAVALSDVVLESPRISLRRGGQGRALLDRLASPTGGSAASASPTRPQDAPGLRWSVDTLRVEDAAIALDDRVPEPAVALGLQPVRLVLSGLASAPAAGQAGRPVGFELQAAGDGGERLAARGSVSLQPLAAEGSAEASGIALARWRPYLGQALPFEPAAGVLAMRSDFRLAVPDEAAADFRATGLNASIDGLELTRGKEPVLRLASIAVGGVDLDWAARRVGVADLSLAGGRLGVTRAADGSVDLAALRGAGGNAPAAGTPGIPAPASMTSVAAPASAMASVPAPASAAAPAVAPPAPPSWSWRIGRARLALAAEIEDRAVSPATRALLTLDEASIEDLASGAGQRARVDARARIDRGGSVRATGTVGFDPDVSAALDLEVRSLAIVPWAAYYAPYVTPRVTDGTVGARGRLELRTAPALQVSWRGDLSTRGVRVLSPDESDGELLRWRSADVSGLKAGFVAGSSEPASIDVDTIDIDGLFARLVLGADGTSNFQGLVGAADRAQSAGDAPGAAGPRRGPGRVAAQVAGGAGGAGGGAGAASAGVGESPDYGASSGGGAPTAAVAAPTASAAAVRIGRIAVRDSTVAYSDLLIRPNVSLRLQELGGTITSIAPGVPGEVRLAGRVGGSAPVEVVGRVDPFSPQLFVDLALDARGIDLPPGSPYAAKYAGYGIERGKLTLGLKYKVENGQLAAENRLVLDELSLGEPTGSPDATKLPVRLLLSLLKDRDGRIDLQIPVSGSLDDPQFSLGSLIGRAVTRILARIVTAPFAFLARAGGNDAAGADAAVLSFTPGSARLPEAAEGKLAPLAQSLADRPALRIDLIGHADAAVDREPLVDRAVDRMLRRTKALRDGADADAAGRTDAVTVEPAEREALMLATWRDAELPGKPRGSLGPANAPPPDVAEIERRLRATVEVGEEDLRSLAARRARAAQAALVARGVPAERLFLVTPRLASGAAEAGTSDARAPATVRGVEMALR